MAVNALNAVSAAAAAATRVLAVAGASGRCIEMVNLAETLVVTMTQNPVQRVRSAAHDALQVGFLKP